MLNPMLNLMQILFLAVFITTYSSAADSEQKNITLSLEYSLAEVESSNSLQHCEALEITHGIKENFCLDFDIDYSINDQVLFISNIRIQTERLKNNYQIETKSLVLSTLPINTFSATNFIEPETIITDEDVGFLFKSGYYQTQLLTVDNINNKLNVEINLSFLSKNLGPSLSDMHLKPLTVDKSVGKVFTTLLKNNQTKYCALKGGKIYCWGINNSYRSISQFPNFNTIFNITNENSTRYSSYTTKPDKICISSYQESGLPEKCITDKNNIVAIQNYIISKAQPEHFLGSEDDPILDIVDFSGNNLSFCAIFSKSRIKCWGKSLYTRFILIGNELNQNVFLEELRTKDYIYLGNSNLEIVQMVYESQSMCTLFNNARVKCWGSNQYGQLGRNRSILPDRTFSYNKLQYLELGKTKVKKFITTTHNKHNSALYCIQYMTNEYKCWGDNESGALGKKFPEVTAPFISVSTGDINTVPNLNFGTNDLTDSKLIIGRFNLCLKFKFGKVKCWGLPQSKQKFSTPIDQSVLLASGDHFLESNNSPVIEIYPSMKNIFYTLHENNELLAWTQNDIYNYIAENPVRSVNKISLGNDKLRNFYSTYLINYLLLDSGVVKAFKSGLLGVPLFTDPDLNPNVSVHIDNMKTLNLGDSPVNKIFTPRNGPTCALFENNKLKCWGQNSFGELGQPTPDYEVKTFSDKLKSLKYIDFGSNLRLVDIHLGKNQNICAEFEDFSLKCWGDNKYLITSQSPDRLTYGRKQDDIKNLKFITFK